jgi:hypothetical protein
MWGAILGGAWMLMRKSKVEKALENGVKEIQKEQQTEAAQSGYFTF